MDPLFFGYVRRPGAAFLFAPPPWLILRFFHNPEDFTQSCGHCEGFPTTEGLRTHCKVTEEQTFLFRNLRWRKLVDLDEQKQEE